MADIYTKVKHTDYINLIKSVDALKQENAKLKADLAKAKKENQKTTKKEDVTEKVTNTKGVAKDA